MPDYYHSITTLHALQNAWRAVRAKNAAGGIDGFTLSHFEKRLNDNLIELQHELISQTWNPEPYLRIEITKNETEKRKLGLLCIKDKIVQQAIKTAIEPQLEKTFLNLSYGYRPNKGPERAIKRVVHDLKKLKSGYVAKLDIDNYFDTINHERLFTRLANWLKDDETLRLIRLCIQTGIVTPQLQWQEINKGVPQGAILSPLLANFYLHPFDQFAANKVPMYIRYADDFLIATSTEKQIKEAVELVKEENPEAVFVGGTQDGKDIAPVVAAKCNTGCASDVLDIKAEDGEVIYTCPLYGGTVLEDVKIKTTPQIATLRSGAFQKVEDPTEGEVVAKEVKVADDVIKAKITESVKEIAETINLEEAEVIVSGGRGMGSKENFALVDDLAKLLGGVVGATRPAIEDGWVSKIHQVGQSGKIVAPKLYIACGISGATQHVSGIMNSGYIVAINKDEDAPIFDVANVGIVGDVMKVLPVMIEEIKKIKDAQ